MTSTATRTPGIRTPAAAPTHRRLRLAAWVTTLAVVLVLSVATAITIGPSSVGLGAVWTSLLHHLGLSPAQIPALQDGIIWQLRAPRVLTAAAVGAGLGLSGAVMQAVTRNTLADPYLLGLSSGASLGAVTVLLLGATLLLPVAAFVGAALALGLTLLLAGAGGRLTPARTILAGVAVSAVAAAATSFVIFWTASGDSYQEILSWILGSVSGSTWTDAAIAGAGLLVAGVPLLFTGRLLDAFAFGDTAASALGVNVTGARYALLGTTALLTGAMVSVSGSIGFVGLVLPHIVRLLVGSGHRALLPLSALAGAVFLVWADTVARTLFDPRELPVGIVTALLGAPVFAMLILRRGRAA